MVPLGTIHVLTALHESQDMCNGRGGCAIVTGRMGLGPAVESAMCEAGCGGCMMGKTRMNRHKLSRLRFLDWSNTVQRSGLEAPGSGVTPRVVLYAVLRVMLGVIVTAACCATCAGRAGSRL